MKVLQKRLESIFLTEKKARGEREGKRKGKGRKENPDKAKQRKQLNRACNQTKKIFSLV